MITSGYREATSRYGSHMGTCHHMPAYAWAQEKGKEGRVEINAEMYPGLDGPALQEKAIAILRNRKQGKFGNRHG